MVSTVLAMPAVSLLIASEGPSFSGREAKHLVTSFSATEMTFSRAFLSTLHSLLMHCKHKEDNNSVEVVVKWMK